MTDLSDQNFFDAIRASIEKGQANREKFAEQYRRDTAKWRLEAAERALLVRLTTRPISHRALLSNERVRAAAQNALITALVEQFRCNPRRQWLFITICWDAGVTWERKPDIDSESLRNVIYLHLKRCGLEGFGVVETDVWKDLAGEPGRRMVSHIHFIGYRPDGKHVKVRNLEAELRARPALCNSLGARSVDVQNVDPTPEDFAQIGQYMFKAPAYAKNPVPKLLKGETIYEFHDVEHKGGSAARLVEVFSHCEIGDIMFSIGKGAGADIAKEVRKAVKHEIRERPKAISAPSRDEVEQLWKDIRQINGSKNLRPCRIITRADQRDREKWVRDALTTKNFSR